MIEFVRGSMCPPPPAARLAALEEHFEQRFPPAYLAFLARGNGARIVRNNVETSFCSFVIERFLPIVADPATDPEGWADVAVVVTQLDARLVVDENGFGYVLLPFAALFGGDFLVLDYREGIGAPSVARWDHERSDDLAPVADMVAPSFEAFVALLDGPAASAA